MGIKVAAPSTEDQLRADLKLLEGYYDRAGVGTLEVPPDVAERLMLNAARIINFLAEAETEADEAWDALENEKAMVSHLKRQAANLKGQITKLKQRVDKKS